eukprot:scaffold116681_cov57-Phaeocystis_antarctica.AAC.3
MADEFLLVDFVKVDVDANQEVSQQCGVPRAWTHPCTRPLVRTRPLVPTLTPDPHPHPNP